MGAILAFIGGLAVAFGLSAYRGLLLSTFWSWFVVSAFPGVPRIGIASAIGLSLLIGVVTHQHSEDESKMGFGKSLLMGLVKTTIYFAIGWVITWFM